MLYHIKSQISGETIGTAQSSEEARRKADAEGTITMFRRKAYPRAYVEDESSKVVYAKYADPEETIDRF